MISGYPAARQLPASSIDSQPLPYPSCHRKKFKPSIDSDIAVGDLTLFGNNMKTIIKLLMLAQPLLLGSCGIARQSGDSGPLAKKETRNEVLRFDAQHVKTMTSMPPRQGRLRCTDTLEVEMKRITSPTGVIAERWIVTHPTCNITSVYYVSREEIKPGVYVTSVGTGFPTE